MQTTGVIRAVADGMKDILDEYGVRPGEPAKQMEAIEAYSHMRQTQAILETAIATMSGPNDPGAAVANGIAVMAVQHAKELLKKALPADYTLESPAAMLLCSGICRAQETHEAIREQLNYDPDRSPDLKEASASKALLEFLNKQDKKLEEMAIQRARESHAAHWPSGR
jgi:hypothetical protein